ncbi:MAG: DUF7793 family protein, partial [Bacteroidia bacterium]
MVEQLSHIEKKRELAFFSIVLRSDGIVHVQIKGKDEVDLAGAKEIIKCIGEICEGQKRPTLVSSEFFAAPNSEARAFLAKKESNPYSSAAAYIASSLPERIVMNAFLKFNKPARPTKMFTNTDAAIKWLQTF